MEYVVKLFIENEASLLDNVVILNSGYDYIRIMRYGSNKLNYIFKCQNSDKIDSNIICMNAIHRKLINIKPKNIIKIEEYQPQISEEKNNIIIQVDKIGKGILHQTNEILTATHQSLLNHVLQRGQQYIISIDDTKYLLKIIDIKINEYYNQGNIIINFLEKNNILQEIDPIKMGIGGLSEEFREIFRRTLISRNYPELVKQFGIKHIKGIILYGPPGCGKTLIAKKLSENLNCVNPKIINGPEILNKYVGESEKNIRDLFTDAEKDFEEYGENSPLHVIIFDEIDAICMTRSDTKTQIVTQLLTKMQGCYELDNILIIGMTNRIDIIDPALLRSGRFEIQMEISLPNEKGRLEILKIHTSKMIENDLTQDINLCEIAQLTKNYTGAELEGLIRNAVSYVLSRKYDNYQNVKLTQNDLLTALQNMKTLYGFSNEDNSIDIEIDWEVIKSLVVDNVKIAKGIAKRYNFSYVTIINNYNFIGLTKLQKVIKIKEIYDNALKCNKSMLIFENIEQILEYHKIYETIRYSNTMLNLLTTLLTLNDNIKIILHCKTNILNNLNLNINKIILEKNNNENIIT